MRTSLKVLEAQERVVKATLRFLEAERAPAGDPHGDDELDYATDEMALAAREFVAHISVLPSSDRPVGWEAPVVL